MRSRLVRRSSSSPLWLLTGLAFVLACGELDPAEGDDPHEEDPLEIAGNIVPDDFAGLHTVGFILVGERYHFFEMPGQAVTSISGLDVARGLAYGWARASADPNTANEVGFILDLRASTFEEVRFPNVDRTVVRGVDARGRLVGLANVRATGESFGFVYDLDAGSAVEVRRPGRTHLGLNDANASGAVVGYSNFGLEGFVLENGAFIALETPEAARLFPMQIDSGGTIVGLLGEHGAPWDRASGFIATPSAGGYTIETYRVTGDHPTALSGINDSGVLVGLYNPNGLDAPGRIFKADGPDAFSQTLPLPEPNLDPWISGLSNEGHVFGSVRILHIPTTEDECGGHGHLHGTQCHCDSGYVQDPDDAANCIPA